MSAGEQHELLAPPAAGRVDSYLAGQLPDLSRSKLKALIKAGDVLVDGVVVKPSTKLEGGERVSVVVPPPEPSELIPEDLALDIIYQDDDLVVVAKAAGMVVHPACGHRSGTLVHGLLHALPGLGNGQQQGERPGIVHRIDKGTSGLLVVARHELALRRLQAAFAIHDIHREYLAVVHGAPRFLEGTVRSQLGRHPRDRVRFATVEQGGKPAVTHWRRIASAGGVSLLSCQLETGRTHQIRVHLQELGHPVVGDPLYSGGSHLSAGLRHWESCLDHQLLHARELGFAHPISGEPMRFCAPPPQDFLALCAEAGIEVPSP